MLSSTVKQKCLIRSPPFLSFDTYMKSMRAYMGYSDEPYDDMDLGAILSDMIGMEEPIPVYTNIENGFGLVASKSRDVITITDIQKQ